MNNKYDEIKERIDFIRETYTEKITEFNFLFLKLPSEHIFIKNHIIYEILETIEFNSMVIFDIENDIGKRVSPKEMLRNNMALLTGIYATQDSMKCLFDIFNVLAEDNESAKKIRKIRNETIGHPISTKREKKKDEKNEKKDNVINLYSTTVWNYIYDDSFYNKISYLYRKNGEFNKQEEKEYEIKNVINEYFDYVIKSLNSIIEKIADLIEDYIISFWLPLANGCLNKNYEIIASKCFNTENLFCSKYFQYYETENLTLEYFLYITKNENIKECKIKIYEIIYLILNVIYNEDNGWLSILKQIDFMLSKESNVVKELENKLSNNISFYTKLQVLFDESIKLGNAESIKSYLPTNFSDLIINYNKRDKEKLKKTKQNGYTQIDFRNYFNDLRNAYCYDDIILYYLDKIENFYSKKYHIMDNYENKFNEYKTNCFYLKWLIKLLERIEI